MDRDRSKWTTWGTRILFEDSGQYMIYGQYMKDKGLIKNLEKFSISRFVLLSLLKTVKNKVNSKRE